ncbi:MAG: hypothetical protein ABNG98_01865 [Flavobacterium sp.]|jgi:predicted metal-dependent HD superfamily phosphohydrolase
MELQNRFINLLEQIGFPKNQNNTLWLELEKAYTSKSRKYHNLQHIEAMVNSYCEYKEQLKLPNEVLYAIFYHDIIYKTTRKDNEQKSAEHAVSILPKNARLNSELIYDMICATQHHQKNKMEDVNWLIDFDLKILASKWEDYQTYFKQIRKEYKIYPEILYKPGRKKALEHFLENEFIFQTEEFRTKYEAIARENILNELSLF